MRRALILAALTLGAIVLGPVAQVFAHADYDHSTPNAGETVTTAPTQVDVYFSQEVANTPGANGLNVTNASAADVDNNDAAVDTADRTHMTITLQSGLANGLYTVAWNTTSAEDEDTDDGTFTFAIEAAQAEPSPQATEPEPEATAAASGQLPTSGTGDALGGGAAGSWLVQLAALALTGAGLVWLGGYRLRQRD